MDSLIFLFLAAVTVIYNVRADGVSDEVPTLPRQLTIPSPEAVNFYDADATAPIESRLSRPVRQVKFGHGFGGTVPIIGVNSQSQAQSITASINFGPLGASISSTNAQSQSHSGSNSGIGSHFGDPLGYGPGYGGGFGGSNSHASAAASSGSGGGFFGGPSFSQSHASASAGSSGFGHGGYYPYGGGGGFGYPGGYGGYHHGGYYGHHHHGGGFGYPGGFGGGLYPGAGFGGYPGAFGYGRGALRSGGDAGGSTETKAEAASSAKSGSINF